MKPLLIRTFLIMCLFTVPCHASAPEKKAAPIVEHLLVLIQSKDQAVSLGAMLVSVGIYDYWRLDPFVRQSMKEADPQWVKAIKTYTICSYTLDDKDTALFVATMPEDQENFDRLIDFESSVTRHPGSNILYSLMAIAKNGDTQELRSQASLKLERIRPLADGWVADSISPKP